MTISIHTDGSFRDDIMAWAFVVSQDKEVIHQASGILSDPKPDLLKIRNVGAELTAVMRAVNWALGTQHYDIVIYHDYEGVAYWVNGQWKAKNYYVKQYVEWMRKLNNGRINIKFHWVKGHADDELNKLADKLAKQALKDS